MSNGTDNKEEIREAANALSNALDADVFVFNFEVSASIDFRFRVKMAEREPRTNLVMFITTEGGSADSAFRIMRLVQERYKRITVVVPGWCKSAGTLMCIGAHDLQIGDLGELGPLDVQIVKVDELDEQKSGLVAEAAFEKMQQEASKFFMQFVADMGGSGYRVTLRTAAEIATNMTVGVMSPIFAKLDPTTVGEDYRSNRLAHAYAERLNLYSRNLERSQRVDALTNLLSGYPSHGFVIDRKEASSLFKRVRAMTPEVERVVDLKFGDMILPRNRRQEQSPIMEFLNDEAVPPASSGPNPLSATGPGPSGGSPDDVVGEGTEDDAGDPGKGSESRDEPPSEGTTSTEPPVND